MSASTSSSPTPKNKTFSPKDAEVEERKGLLIDADENLDDHDEYFEDDIPTTRSSWSRRKITTTAIVIIGLLVTGALARTVLFGSPGRMTNHSAFSGEELRSNGTALFKRTVVVVSIDGLRADYLDRGFTPHLLALSKKGLRAKSMKPIFPTLTFPNHWAIMTGLHAESHGIVANNFWDPVTGEEFHYNQIKSAWISSWWFGEPMWETAEKAGVTAANLMWPGPPKTTSGSSATYFVPWKDKVPLEDKLKQILNWIDLPLDKRPQLILAYEPSLDQAGHATGPYSERVNHTLVQVDVFAKELHDSIAARNLTDIVDIVFVSDHGMTDTSNPEPVYMDDILGKEGIAAIAHEDGWPSMGLRFHEHANLSKHLDALLKASDNNPEKFDVYTHETMPERYHFANNERIAPIYVVPKIGYILTTHAEGNTGMSKGNHGYDNEEVSMQAMFVAHGPFSHQAKAQHQRRSKIAHLSSRAHEGWHSTSDDTYIMNTFQNVEIYNLVMKLLGIENIANNNGTLGFWDQYL
uniref:Phosphodiest-domain-containing protein n=1 Tax=Psilocybe cubensis TaxID=181762 RepID=A0A8H7XQR2_PSICU